MSTAELLAMIDETVSDYESHAGEPENVPTSLRSRFFCNACHKRHGGKCKPTTGTYPARKSKERK